MSKTLALFAAALGLLVWAGSTLAPQPSCPAKVGAEATARVTRPVALTVLVDRSASMEGARLAEARAWAREAIADLRPTDRVSVVSFAADERVELPLTPLGSASERIDGALARLRAGGSTELEGGLAAALRQLHTAPPGSDRRVLVLTDAFRSGQAMPAVLGGLLHLALSRGIRVDVKETDARPIAGTVARTSFLDTRGAGLLGVGR